MVYIHWKAMRFPTILIDFTGEVAKKLEIILSQHRWRDIPYKFGRKDMKPATAKNTPHNVDIRNDDMNEM